MPKKVELIETPKGTAKRCTVCGIVKLLPLFAKDARYEDGYGQPCATCKNKAKQARRLRSNAVSRSPKSVPHAKKPKVAKTVPAAESMRESAVKGGAARAAKDKIDSHPKPATPAEVSLRLYSQAGRALKESWFDIDRELYERHIAMLDSSYPGKDGTDFQHALFHSYAKGVIARYGG